MLRYALGVQRDDREEVTLAEELDFVRAYLGRVAAYCNSTGSWIPRIDHAADFASGGAAVAAGHRHANLGSMSERVRALVVEDEAPAGDACSSCWVASNGSTAWVRRRTESGQSRSSTHCVPTSSFSISNYLGYPVSTCCERCSINRP